MPAATPDPDWLSDRRQAAAYAHYHLHTDSAGPDPAEFGAIWANMRRGNRVGELRELPRLADAFADWAAEHGVVLPGPPRPFVPRPADRRHHSVPV
ncbi:hypothetical protein ACFPM7_28905 [Actinokineospora guangxiensis]|uniref:Uncharacterized protein n=1 Tax=Actinokineospora guangxiensis TaxID=1490288 RepID=A0ABW0EY46_9PSEU